MENYRMAIENFIVEKKLKESSNTLGIILYGSYSHGRVTPNSKIDLLILTENGQNYRGTVTISSFAIHYLVYPAFLVISKIPSYVYRQDHFLATSLLTGQVLYDPLRAVSLLKKYSQEVLNGEIPKSIFTVEDKTKMIKLVDGAKIEIEKASVFADHHYYCALNELREMYHHIKGKSSLPVDRISNIYSDVNYASSYMASLPNSEFCSNYLEAIKNNRSSKEKLSYLDYFFSQLRIELPLKSSLDFDSREPTFIMTEDWIKEEYLALSSQLLRTEIALEQKYDYSDSLYHLTIERMLHFYKQNQGKKQLNPDSCFDVGENYLMNPEHILFYKKSLQSTTVVEKKRSLNDLFHFTFKNIQMNPINCEFRIK